MCIVTAYILIEECLQNFKRVILSQVIKGRRGRILKEELSEGMDLFIVTAYMPVEACLASHRGEQARDKQERDGREGHRAAQPSFSDELRRETSGAASVSLMLSHWERLQVCNMEIHHMEYGNVPLYFFLRNSNTFRLLPNSVRRTKICLRCCYCLIGMALSNIQGT